MNEQQILLSAINFINYEADLLDQEEFNHWLTLWKPEGHYIIPIDQKTEDFANTLNYAYDNQHMREKRVNRLYSGESISTTPRARTIRMLARHRLLHASEDCVEVRCAQSLWEYRKGNAQHYVADVTYTLVPQDNSFQILKKVIRVINGQEYLRSIGYIM